MIVLPERRMLPEWRGPDLPGWPRSGWGWWPGDGSAVVASGGVVALRLLLFDYNSYF